MGDRPRRAYLRASVRRLRETRGQTTVEWLVAMVAVLALAGAGVVVLVLVEGRPRIVRTIVAGSTR